MIKVGLWGCGGISPAHRRAYQALEEMGMDVKLVALCDINPESFNKEVKINIQTGNEKPLAKIDHCYTDADEMFANEDLDLVDICLPAFLHRDSVIKALGKNINVLCEKPMAMTLEECREIIEAEKKSKARLMIAQCVRFETVSDWLKNAIENKTYGEVISADFSRISALPTWRFTKGKEYSSKHDGVIFDMHLHDVDLVNYLFGVPDEVFASSSTKFTFCDSVSTIFSYKNKVVSIRGDWGFPQSYPFSATWQVNFENACAVLDKDKKITVYTDEKQEVVNLENIDSFASEIKYFAEIIRDDAENTKNPPESTLKTMELIEKIGQITNN